jgi:hypothetical protein
MHGEAPVLLPPGDHLHEDIMTATTDSFGPDAAGAFGRRLGYSPVAPIPPVRPPSA